MTYVIDGGCCSDASCLDVCPVDCIRPRPGDPEFISAEQLYIDPATCTDCAACVVECPVSAIHDEWDLPEHLNVFRDLNADYFVAHPLEALPSARKPRRRLPQGHPGLRVAVVGAGAAGCYAVEELCGVAGVEVSVFDRRPAPFGLVRSGVAPDHARTKEITLRFERSLGRPNVSCYFNVAVGVDLSVAELLKHHHAVVIAVGAGDDRMLGIRGEDLPGSHAAREFVGWYNGDPEAAQRAFDLSGTTAVVIGNGNVAIDVARVLASPVESLRSTDISPIALEALSRSRIREVVVVGRGGPQEAAYTASGLEALTRVPGIEVVADPAEVARAFDGAPEPTWSATRKLNLNRNLPAEAFRGSGKAVRLRYFATPVSINGGAAVESVTLQRRGGELETIEAGLVLRAIGYRAVPVEGVPYDHTSSTIPHEAGRVLVSETGRPVGGLYCTGWVKRGAAGVIGTNRMDSAETVDAIFSDASAGVLPQPAGSRDDLAGAVAASRADSVDYAGWRRIDAAERDRGRASGAARVKFVSVADLLAASRA
ncbi:MAG: putative Ferredoxin-NADP reductase [Aeromicrobium sp.]|nr:putative Ferredoxin-NADP reductase [Aeromicrobium sp.]